MEKYKVESWNDYVSGTLVPVRKILKPCKFKPMARGFYNEKILAFLVRQAKPKGDINNKIEVVM